MVLGVDEKSQMQALDRTQPGLPLKKGRCGTPTHDSVRHGTTTLCAALEVLEGRGIGQCLPRHRHQEFPKFLRPLDARSPKGLDLRLILDNYGTHRLGIGWRTHRPYLRGEGHCLQHPIEQLIEPGLAFGNRSATTQNSFCSRSFLPV